MQNKYCRICWNTNGWQRPSKDAALIETGNSYVAQNLFGHEEWLFNFEWVIGGFRYGFLQPIGKYYKKYAGESCSITLYTLSPKKETLIVGYLRNVYVPTEDELEKVLGVAREQGWLNEMRSSIKRIGGNVGMLKDPKAKELFNIRFRPRDAEILDPMIKVIGKHKIIQPPLYYQPYDWQENDDLKTENRVKNRSLIDPRRSEDLQIRSAQKGVQVDPKHIRLQNRLYETLCSKYGTKNVDYEANFVDLTLRLNDKTIFFEIKTDQTARRCIRNAIGQLLDYAYYPEKESSTCLVIVGDAPSTNEDRIYLDFLRNKFDLEVQYSQFIWETNMLEGKI